MARLTLDFAGVEGSKFLNAEGDFVFVVDEADIVDAKKGGSQNLVFKCHVDSPGANNGQELTHYVNLGENALWSARLFLEALTHTEIGENEFEVDTSLYTGCRFGATVVKTQSGGKTYYNIDTVYAV